MKRVEDNRRTWKLSASVSRPVRDLVERAARRKGVSLASIVRSGSIREAETVLEGGQHERD